MRIKYIANDGSEFNTQQEALNHEKILANQEVHIYWLDGIAFKSAQSTGYKEIIPESHIASNKI